MGKRKEVLRLAVITVVLSVFIAIVFALNLNYIQSLNSFFSIVTDKNGEVASAVNAGRLQMNKEFMITEVVLGAITLILLIVDILCVKSLIKKYKVLAKTYENLAKKDTLTGTWSRTALVEDFAAIKKKQSVKNIAYFLFDMNYLKQINDGYGHKVGDDFLIAMSKCIRNAFGDLGRVYRLDGDEFVGVITKPELVDPEKINEAIDKEVNKFNTESNGTNVKLSFSKGYCVDKFDYTDKDFDATLYTLADNAMYAEKEAFHKLHPRTERIDRVTKQVVVRKL